jgi:SAM-dependent methyltransferase
VPRPEIQRTLDLLPSDARVLDVGAGGRRITPTIVAFDAFPTAGVDIVGDIHNMPIPSESFDCVFGTGTLEHVADPWQSVREIHRVLKSGGIVHIDVPFMQGYDADPTDYWRFTLDGLKLLCKEFDEMEAGVHIGPSSAVVWVLREWADSCFTNRYLSNLFLALVAVMVSPFKYLDYLLIRKPKSHRVASAVFFRGRKPISRLDRTPPVAGGREEPGQTR